MWVEHTSFAQVLPPCARKGYTLTKRTCNDVGSTPHTSVIYAGLFIVHLFTYTHRFNAVMYVPANFELYRLIVG